MHGITFVSGLLISLDMRFIAGLRSTDIAIALLAVSVCRNKQLLRLSTARLAFFVFYGIYISGLAIFSLDGGRPLAPSFIAFTAAVFYVQVLGAFQTIYLRDLMIGLVAGLIIQMTLALTITNTVQTYTDLRIDGFSYLIKPRMTAFDGQFHAFSLFFLMLIMWNRIGNNFAHVVGWSLTALILLYSESRLLLLSVLAYLIGRRLHPVVIVLTLPILMALPLVLGELAEIPVVGDALNLRGESRRQILIDETLPKIGDQFPFGVGVRTESDQIIIENFQPYFLHSDFIGTLYHGGIFGVSFFLMFIAAGVAVLNKKTNKQYRRTLSGVLVASVTALSFSSIIVPGQRLFLIPIGLFLLLMRK